MLDYDREVARCHATSDGDAGKRDHQGRRRTGERGRHLPEMAGRRVFLG